MICEKSRPAPALEQNKKKDNGGKIERFLTKLFVQRPKIPKTPAFQPIPTTDLDAANAFAESQNSEVELIYTCACECKTITRIVHESARVRFEQEMVKDRMSCTHTVKAGWEHPSWWLRRDNEKRFIRGMQKEVLDEKFLTSTKCPNCKVVKNWYIQKRQANVRGSVYFLCALRDG